MKNNPVIWFEIYVQDMQRAKAFYETVFQTDLTQLNHPDIEMWGFPMARNTPGAGGSLVKIEGIPSGSSGTLVYFRCDDCAVEAARVADAGGKLHKEKFSIGEYGFIAMAYDTEGNLFGLHSFQ